MNYAGYGSAGIGGIQIGMSTYRQSLSLNSKIGTFSRFSLNYGRLGTASKLLGNTSTYVGAPLTTYLDYNSMQSGEISAERFSFRLGGTVSSIFGGAAIGAELGGPWGAVGGTAISGLFWAGEQSYDGIVWFGNQLSQGLVNTENALKGGCIQEDDSKYYNKQSYKSNQVSSNRNRYNGNCLVSFKMG